MLVAGFALLRLPRGRGVRVGVGVEVIGLTFIAEQKPFIFRFETVSRRRSGAGLGVRSARRLEGDRVDPVAERVAFARGGGEVAEGGRQVVAGGLGGAV